MKLVGKTQNVDVINKHFATSRLMTSGELQNVTHVLRAALAGDNIIASDLPTVPVRLLVQIWELIQKPKSPEGLLSH